jgi:hypothetical protein
VTALTDGEINVKDEEFQQPPDDVDELQSVVDREKRAKEYEQ